MIVVTARFTASEREAVAAPAPEPGVAIARTVHRREQLVRGVSAPLLMTLGAVVVFHWNSGTCGLANVQWSPVAAEYLHGRPFG